MSKDDAIKIYLEDKGINATGAINTIGNNIDFYIELAAMFVDESDEKYTELKNYKDTGDTYNYIILVHSLKSDAIIIGAAKLSVLARSHEREGKKGNTDYFTDNWDSLIREWNTTVTKVKAFLDIVK